MLSAIWLGWVIPKFSSLRLPDPAIYSIEQ
jgi:hypothetical protein